MSQSETDIKERRDAERLPANLPIKLAIDTDVLHPTCLDASRTGIGFTVSGPIPIKISADINGQLVTRKGHLVYARPIEDGAYRIGVEYIGENTG